MDYNIALSIGKISFILVLIAPLYSVLRTLFTVSISHGISPNIAKLLRSSVMYTRITHPYLGAFIPFCALYHIYVMWLSHVIGLKVLLGILLAFGLFSMVGLGIMLKSQPANFHLRKAHRVSALLIITLAILHRIA
ncbi:MAG: hypothetical protein K0R78_1117 [Pelosinus sp.]|jgi:hypothetical protein|nr:hypothetical protein [Pelosinus sp.]